MSEKSDQKTETGRTAESFSLQPKRTRRTPDDVNASILRFAKKGALLTQIMYGCQLSYSQIQDHLKSLNDKGLLEIKESEGHKVYLATEKGKRWLDLFGQMREIEGK